MPDLTPYSFGQLAQLFKEAFSAAGTTALKAFLESCDATEDVLVTALGKPMQNEERQGVPGPLWVGSLVIFLRSFHMYKPMRAFIANHS